MDPITDAKNVIAQAVVNVAKDPGTALKTTDAAAVAKSLNTEMVPILINATNNEPWYQSRVMLGSLLAVLAGLLGIFGIVFPAEIQGQVIDAVIAAAPLIGGALAIYGRIKARKPIGS